MPGTWTVFRMSSRQKKRYAEMVGGEKISKQRPLRQRIRDVKRVLSRVRVCVCVLDNISFN